MVCSNQRYATGGIIPPRRIIDDVTGALKGLVDDELETLEKSVKREVRRRKLKQLKNNY